MPARLACQVAALLIAGSAFAAEPLPGGIPDLTGPRMLGMAAGIGAAQGNDGIFVNPGAMGARQRYSIDTTLLLDRRGADTVGQYYTGSIVDSKSSPLAAGVAFTRAQKGDFTGNMVNLAFGGPLVDKLWLGVAGKYLSLKGDAVPPATGRVNVSAATMDVGVLLQVSEQLSVGGAGYNLVSIGNERVGPQGAGAGIAIGSDQWVQVTADWRGDFERRGKSTNRYAVGAEVLLGRFFPVRGGFVKDETLDAQWWSVGAGFMSESGAAIDVAYRQSTKDPSARTIAASIRLFLFN